MGRWRQNHVQPDFLKMLLKGFRYKEGGDIRAITSR